MQSDYSADKVKVSHQGHISEGRLRIGDRTLGVLKSNTIQFTPSLFKQKRSNSKTGMVVNKFLLTWSRSFGMMFNIYPTPQAKR